MTPGDIDAAAIARGLAAMGRGRLALVDVGAAGGVPRRWAPVEEWLLIVGFEPDERNFASLEPSEGRIWLNTALWREATTVELHLARKSQNTSVLVPNREFIERFSHPERFDVIGTTRVETSTLDEALGTVPIPRVDFLKLDVQGGELAVLEGARSTLSAGVFGIDLEVAYAPMYEGQPLVGEIDQFLRPEGFALIDLRRTYWKTDRYAETWGAKGQLVAGDALYLRDPATFLGLVERSPRDDAREAVINALVTCVVYGYLSLALELLDEASSGGLIEGEDARRARGWLGRRPRFGVERLPARLRPRAARIGGGVQRWAERIGERARRFAPAGGWPPSQKRRGRTGDGELGNR